MDKKIVLKLKYCIYVFETLNSTDIHTDDIIFHAEHIGSKDEF